MTLTQRLTRAGLVFVLLGTVAALIPTNGTANAATMCSTGGTAYTLGTGPGDTTMTYTLGTTLTLNTYVNSTQTAPASFTASNNTDFTNTSSSGSSITITPKSTASASETVTAAFGTNLPTVSVTVNK